MTWAACILANQSRATPAHVAIQQDGIEIAYQRLHQQTCATASALTGIGVRSGTHLAFVPTGTWYDVALLWAIWRLSAVACPVSGRLPRKQQRELAQRVTQTHFLDRQAVVRLLDSKAHQQDEAMPQIEFDAPATVLFSSGSGGQAKAIVHSLRGHVVNAQGSATNIAINRDARWLWNLPVDHISGMAIMFRTILAGATLVIDTQKSPLDRLIARCELTHLSVVATQLFRLLQSSDDHFDSLQAVLLGGGPCGHELLRQALERGLPLHTTYGLTEMASQVTATATREELRKGITAGRVLPSRELKICPDGEILVRGPTLCLGYFQDGVLVSVTNADGWFATRDIGHLDNTGCLTILGRKDRMFISGGENIHPEEIEMAMMSLPGIAQTIVVPIPDREFGQRPVAFVDCSVFCPDQWQEGLRQTLPSFKIPTAFYPWPDTGGAGIKPSRSWLAEQATQQNGQ